MRITKKMYLGVASLLVAAGAFVGLLSLTGTSVDALTMGERRDCGYTDVIIDCGAISTAELLQKYDSNNDGRGNHDIQAIYNHYGIQRSDIAGTTSEVKKGWLSTNGTIAVDGVTVATDAQSLYRVDPGHPVSPVTIAGKTYYIGPVSGSYSLGADVYVFFRDGVFYNAIQASCGNPIIAVPTKPKPVYSCDSLTATKIDRTKFSFTAAATAKNGANVAHYTYDFGDGKSSTTNSTTVEHTYANPGTYTAKVSVNISVNGVRKEVTGPKCQVTITVNKAPAYACESLKATAITRTNYKFATVASATNGATIVDYNYDFGDGTKTTGGATIEHNYAAAGSYTTTVTVNVKVDGKTVVVDGENCKTTVEVKEAPAYACDSLTATKITRTEFQFNAAASATNGATIESYVYNFGDGQSMTSTNTQVNHTYIAAGTYTATLTVNFKVNGEAKTATSEYCKVTIKVEKAPVYKCDSLKATKISRTEYQFTAAATAANGAEIVSYTYNFGDGTSTTSENTQVNHTYAAAGSYAASVTVNFTVNGETKTATGENCNVAIKVEEAPVYKCDSLKATKISRTEFSFAAAATAQNGATIESYTYNFGDGKSTTSPNTQVNHTYAAAGSYTATLTVNFKVDGGTKTATSENCKVEIKVEEAPAYKCDSLTATKINRTAYQFTAAASASNGATIESYTYNFGDGKSTTSANAQVDHTYAAAGTYTATLTVNFKVNGETKTATGENCKTTITIEAPAYKCESLTATKINRNTFQFTAAASATNGAEIVSYTYNFGDSQSTTSANTQVNHTYAAAGTYTATLTVNFTVDGETKTATGPSCKTTITVEEEKLPVYKCESLTASKINRTTYQFTADATAENGATIVSYTYNFGDGKTTTSANDQVDHIYDAPGTYTATLTVNFTVNGEAKTATGPNCKTTVTVEKESEKPVYKCESLTARLIQDRTYKYTLTYVADGGATLDRAVYSFGDNVNETFLPADATSVEHTFATAGNYTTTATLYFNVPDGDTTVEKSATCEVKINIEEQEMCTVPGKEHLPANSPECKEKEMCEVPGKEHLPKDSPECKEDEFCAVPGKEHLPANSPDCVSPTCEIPGKEHLPVNSPDCVETPPELPKTGLDMFIGGGLGLGSITASVYYWFGSKRNLLDALNNK